MLEALSAADWVALGTQVHGGFGSYIALGIRIGEDSLKTLHAQPREVDVTLFNGAKAPCSCLVDGVMIATSASPGQGTLRVAGEKAPDDELGAVVVRRRSDGRSVRYIVPTSAMPRLLTWNKELDAEGRYRAVMQEPSAKLFHREMLPESIQ